MQILPFLMKTASGLLLAELPSDVFGKGSSRRVGAWNMFMMASDGTRGNTRYIKRTRGPRDVALRVAVDQQAVVAHPVPRAC